MTVRYKERSFLRISGDAAAVLLAIAGTRMLVGWFAAFTTPGLEFIVIGTAVAAATIALRRRPWTTIVAVTLVLIAWFLPCLVGAVYQLARLLST